MANDRPRGLLDGPQPPAEGLLAPQRGDVLPLARDPRTGDISFDPQAGLLGEVIRAFRAPGDVLAGRLDPRSREGMERAGALAGLATGGGLATAARRPGLGMGGAAGAGRQSGRFKLDFFGDEVQVLQNPTQREIEGFLSRSRHKAARRITDPDTGDVFIWDAGDPALHQMVAEQLGVRPDSTLFDMIGLD